MSNNPSIRNGKKNMAGKRFVIHRRMAVNQAVNWFNSKSPRAGLDAFFHSPSCHALKRQICDIGWRLWQRGYADGNGGNIAIRVGEDLALCTPTLVSKGFMKPEDMCLVDFKGNQLFGAKRRRSEILMHLQIERASCRERV